SFVGFAPAEEPVVAIVVTIDEPHGHYYGGEVAAPVFRNIAEKALRYLAISPDQELTPAQLAKHRKNTKAPDLTQDQFEPAEANWEGETIEAIQPQSQTAAMPGPDASTAPFAETASLSGAATVEVPDLRGKSLRRVITETSRLGLLLGTF